LLCSVDRVEPEDLDRDVAIEQLVAAAEDVRHSAAADPLVEAVSVCEDRSGC
jgi:hypothetical protein